MKTMKIIITSTLMVASLLLLASCSSSKKITASGAETSTTVPTDKYPQRDDLTLSASQSQFKGMPSTLDLTITNATTSLVQFGSEFTIEHFLKGKWSVVPKTEMFPMTMILHSLRAGESRSYKFHTRPETVEYKTGKYRISKRVMLDNETNYSVMTEFEIK